MRITRAEDKTREIQKDIRGSTVLPGWTDRACGGLDQILVGRRAGAEDDMMENLK